MCLILFAHDIHPRFRLVLAANRDEIFARPTDPLSRWADDPRIVAGRDREGGGTWLGVTGDGRWAAVTNFREPLIRRPHATSRGHLVTDFLRADQTPRDFCRALLPRSRDYDGFNLLVGDEADVVWLSNRSPSKGEPTPLRLSSGIYGVSNHLLDTPWPKVRRGKAALQRMLERSEPVGTGALLELLNDTTHAPDHELPRTGVDLAMERELSSAFTSTPGYGTRSSSALLIRRDGRISFVERSFDEAGRAVGEEQMTLE